MSLETNLKESTKKLFSHFGTEDPSFFYQKLYDETYELKEWFVENKFDDENFKCGLELEGWFVDEHFLPVPRIHSFMESIQNPCISPELSKYNFEINSPAYDVKKGFLSNFYEDLSNLWAECEKHASNVQAQILTIGILPTLQPGMLTMDMICGERRFDILNRHLFKIRNQKPLEINIKGKGKGHVHFECENLMVEAATTSTQFHLQVPVSKSVRYFNSAQILAGPMLVLAANSPSFYHQLLWDETRVPLFQQSISVLSRAEQKALLPDRVTFGRGHLSHSFFDFFLENLEQYVPLVPLVHEEAPFPLTHLRSHNGTVWRWNRPVIGFDDQKKPHLRIEHRVLSAGNSTRDISANLAFYVGAMRMLAENSVAPESLLSFEIVRENFYQAAKFGMNAKLKWIDGKIYDGVHLLKEVLFPLAKEGLTCFGTSREEIRYFIDEIIGKRLEKRQNGSVWQRKFLSQYKGDYQALTHSYMENQKLGKAIHEWD